VFTRKPSQLHVYTQFSLNLAAFGSGKEIALVSAMKETGIKESLVVTLDEEGEIDKEGFRIHILPAWKYFTA